MTDTSPDTAADTSPATAPGTDAASSLKPGVVRRAVKSYFVEFAKLRTCPREFWVVQWVNLLDGVAYFSMLTASTLYLSHILGYGDKDAANLWAACMATYTGMGFVAGFIGDSLGIKRTLHLSVVVLVVSRLVVSATTNKAAVVPALFAIAIGSAIMTPILISATKRFTTKTNQTAGFNLLYFLMNIGAFLGNAVFDPLVKLQYSYRAIFMLGSSMSILCWVSILLLWHKRISAVDRDRVKAGATDKTASGEKFEAPWTVAISVLRESAFWRFMLFLVILVGVRLVFEHQYQVYPKYYQRTIGADAPIGKLNAINPFIICFGVVVSTPIVARFRLFNVMFFGICVSAVSMVFLMIYPGWFCEALGMTLSQGYLVIAVLQIVVFSVGEVIWSPRLYEYTAAIAPAGREASYMGLSYLPMFFARFGEGPLAGQLLSRYCPPDITDRLPSVPYVDSPQFMCVILGLIAVSSPLLIVAFRGVIQREASTRI